MADTTTTTTSTEGPNPELSVVVNKKPSTLFMSFGLLNKLLGIFGNEEAALSAFYDSELRPRVLEEVLKIRGEYGALEKVVVDDLDIAAEDVSNIFKWVSEHALDFFLRNAEKVKQITSKNEGRIASLGPSPTGSTDSALKTLPAGLLEQPPHVSKD